MHASICDNYIESQSCLYTCVWLFTSMFLIIVLYYFTCRLCHKFLMVFQLMLLNSKLMLVYMQEEEEMVCYKLRTISTQPLL